MPSPAGPRPHFVEEEIAEPFAAIAQHPQHAVVHEIGEQDRVPGRDFLSDRIGLDSVDRDGSSVVLKFRPDAKLDPAWLFRIVQERGDVVLVPPATLKLASCAGAASL